MKKVVIGMIWAIFILAIIILSERALHYRSEFKIWKELAENSVELAAKQEKTLNSSIKNAEHWKNKAEETLKQRDEVLDLADRTATNAEWVHEQLRAALAEIEEYKEHVDGYIKVITWYEEKCGKQKNGK